VLGVRHEIAVGAVHQIFWWDLEPIWDATAVLLPQRDSNGAGEWFFVYAYL